jgi:hypothetical protein
MGLRGIIIGQKRFLKVFLKYLKKSCFLFDIVGEFVRIVQVL